MFTAERVIDDDIQITRVSTVRGTVNGTSDLFALVHRQGFRSIEDGLFPVGVLGTRTGGEVDGFVALGETNIEPTDEGMDIVVTSSCDFKRYLEGQIFLCYGQDIDFLFVENKSVSRWISG
jgi:hypothetical protein